MARQTAAQTRYAQKLGKRGLAKVNARRVSRGYAPLTAGKKGGKAAGGGGGG